MFAAVLISLLLDQLAAWFIQTMYPDLISHTARWFGVISQPWSSIIAIGIVGFLVIYQRPNWPMGLVLGGALSNLLTFFLHSEAIDYITFRSVTTNVADLFIITGLIAYGIMLCCKHERWGGLSG